MKDRIDMAKKLKFRSSEYQRVKAHAQHFFGAEREGCEATPLGPVAGLLEVLPTAYGEPTPDGLTLPLESGDALSLGRLVCRALDV